MIWKALLVFPACLAMIGQAAFGGKGHWKEIETRLSDKRPLITTSSLDEVLKCLQPLKKSRNPIKMFSGQTALKENIERLESLKDQYERKDCTEISQESRLDLFKETESYAKVNRIVKLCVTELSPHCKKRCLVDIERLTKDRKIEGLGEIWYFIRQAILLKSDSEHQKNEEPRSEQIVDFDYVRWASDENVAKLIFDKFIMQTYAMSDGTAARALIDTIYPLVEKRAENLPESSNQATFEQVDKLYSELVKECGKFGKTYNMFALTEQEAKIVNQRDFFWEGEPANLAQYYLGWATYRLCETLQIEGLKSTSNVRQLNADNVNFYKLNRSTEGEDALNEIWFFIHPVIFLELANEDQKNEQIKQNHLAESDYVRWASNESVARSIFDKFIQQTYEMSSDVAAEAAYDAVHILSEKKAGARNNYVPSGWRETQFSLPKPSYEYISDSKIDLLYWDLVGKCHRFITTNDLFAQAEREAEFTRRKFFWEGEPARLAQYYLTWASYKLCDSLRNRVSQIILNVKLMRQARPKVYAFNLAKE